MTTPPKGKVRPDKIKTRNAPGQGTIKERKLANGTIVFDTWVTITDPATRESKKVSKRGHATRKLAQAWINKTVADAEAGLRALVSRGYTVWTCWEGFKKTTPLKESTYLEYERLLLSLCSDMKDLPITAVTQLQVDAMFSRMRKNGVPTSRLFHLIVAWGHVFEYAIAAQAVRYNPARMSPWYNKLFTDFMNERETRKIEKEEEGVIEVISSEQYQALLSTESRETLRNIWEFVGSTGVRRSEVLALEWRDIDLIEGVVWIRRGVADIGGKLVHIPTPKSGRARKIYIDEVTKELLHRQRKLINAWKEYWGDQWEEHNLVFPLMDIRKSNKFPPGHWMLPSNLSVAYLRRAEKLGFGTTKLHGLRFRWATMAFDAGVDPRDIQEHMGHRTLDMTMFTYVKRDENTKREAVAMAGRAIRGELYVAEQTALLPD